MTSAMPNSATCAGLSILFWFSAFSTMTLTPPAAPIRLGSRWCHPTRDQAQEALRQRDRGRTGRHRAEVAVQRDLQAAAHRGAVDERERRHARLAEAAERGVAGLGDLKTLLAAADERHPDRSAPRRR